MTSELAPLVFPAITRTDIVRYAGASGDFNPLHHDPDFAAAAGHDDVMAHGMLSAGLLASALTKWFGAGSVRKFTTRFKNPVWPGDVLTARCSSKIASGDGYDLVLELVRGGGEVVVAATASVRSEVP